VFINISETEESMYSSHAIHGLVQDPLAIAGVLSDPTTSESDMQFIDHLHNVGQEWSAINCNNYVHISRVDFLVKCIH
jgi:hypothetical protein